MSRFSPETWRLTLDTTCWRLAGAGREWSAPAGPEPASALAELGEAGLLRRGRLDVELSDDCLRYLVIEWPNGLKGQAERRAWVAERFRGVHGIDAAGWVMSVDEAGADTALACAAPRTLVEELTRFAFAHRMKLVAMRGGFVAAYNHLQGRMRRQDELTCGALAEYRNGRLTLGLWYRGGWQRIRSARTEGRAAMTLSATLAGWLPGLAATLPGAGPAGVLHARGVMPDTLPHGWRVQPWDACA